jgi:hypothetical protein
MGDGARRPGRFQQLRQHDLIGVCETGLFTTDRTHAHALLDGVAAVFDDALLQHPGLAARMLEIEVSGVNGRAHQLAEHAIEIAGGEATRGQQTTFSQGDQGIHEIFAMCKGVDFIKWGPASGV